MRKGKFHQVGAGSRRRAQARAEDAARRSRKRAAKREAFKREERS